ncbi:Bifunctional metalloprotease/ubiquitin-protein ligase [uncultured virus]|nr:Bifunctional metalloprotease/ubiquitin-protein ligase [uncultured virus]
MKCNNVHLGNGSTRIPHKRIYKTILTDPANHSNSIPIIVKLVFHYLINDCNTRQHVEAVYGYVDNCVHSLNMDFNNYEYMQAYHQVVNHVFANNKPKLTHYQQLAFHVVPTIPSNITFVTERIYFYDTLSQVKISSKTISSRQVIKDTKADAIHPVSCINVWLVDHDSLGFDGTSSNPFAINQSNDPIINSQHMSTYGIVINKSKLATRSFTHHIGHQLGLIGSNLNIINCNQVPFYDPVLWEQLQHDPNYNPVFMTFAELCHNDYCCMFTIDQIKIMRYVAVNVLDLMNADVEFEKSKYLHFDFVDSTSEGLKTMMANVAKINQSKYNQSQVQPPTPSTHHQHINNPDEMKVLQLPEAQSNQMQTSTQGYVSDIPIPIKLADDYQYQRSTQPMPHRMSSTQAMSTPMQSAHPSLSQSMLAPNVTTAQAPVQQPRKFTPFNQQRYAVPLRNNTNPNNTSVSRDTLNPNTSNYEPLIQLLKTDFTKPSSTTTSKPIDRARLNSMMRDVSNGTG